MKHKIDIKKTNGREIFELIEDLCKEYGTDKVKTTVLSCFELIENSKNIPPHEKKSEN